MAMAIVLSNFDEDDDEEEEEEEREEEAHEDQPEAVKTGEAEETPEAPPMLAFCFGAFRNTANGPPTKGSEAGDTKEAETIQPNQGIRSNRAGPRDPKRSSRPEGSETI